MALIKLYDEDGFTIRQEEIERTKKRIDYEYWISPTGRIVKYMFGIENAYKCTSLHSEIAYEVTKKIKGEKYANECQDCQALLFINGWIKIGCLGQRYDIAKKEPTQSQIDVLFGIGISEIFVNEQKTKVI